MPNFFVLPAAVQSPFVAIPRTAKSRIVRGEAVHRGVVRARTQYRHKRAGKKNITCAAPPQEQYKHGGRKRQSGQFTCHQTMQRTPPTRVLPGVFPSEGNAHPTHKATTREHHEKCQMILQRDQNGPTMVANAPAREYNAQSDLPCARDLRHQR